MLNTMFKKKLSNEQLANVFVNGVLDVIDKGFEEVMSLIQEDPAFAKAPDLKHAIDGHFTMIIIVGNLGYLDTSFEYEHVSVLEPLILEKFAAVYDLTPEEFEKHIKEYKSFMNRVNHPSKNLLYSMSKGIFHKYNLNQYQDDYFKKMVCPNPLFLKRMDEVMLNFVWNWDAFFKRYKMIN